jgi:hypothetical protein
VVQSDNATEPSVCVVGISAFGLVWNGLCCLEAFRLRASAIKIGEVQVRVKVGGGGGGGTNWQGKQQEKEKY